MTKLTKSLSENRRNSSSNGGLIGAQNLLSRAVVLCCIAASALALAAGEQEAPPADPATSSSAPAPAAASGMVETKPSEAGGDAASLKTKVAEVQALAEGKQYAAAAAKAKELVEKFPSSHELHNLLGFSLRKQGKFKDSLVPYQEALKLKPDFHQAKEYLAISYLHLKEVKPAQELWRELKSSQPKLAQLVEQEAKKLKIKLK